VFIQSFVKIFALSYVKKKAFVAINNVNCEISVTRIITDDLVFGIIYIESSAIK